MKKVLLGIITVLMIMGLSSDLRAQIPNITTWMIHGGCYHDSQDQHIEFLEITEPFILTINLKRKIMTLDDPQRSREYTRIGPFIENDNRDNVFDAVDEKGVECRIVAAITSRVGYVKIEVAVIYSTHILHWEGILFKQEPKLQANKNKSYEKSI
jgi:hypothetical protein